jgi:hypothetical protein
VLRSESKTVPGASGLIDILRLARELKVDFAFATRTLHMLSAEAEKPQPPFDAVDDVSNGA